MKDIILDILRELQPGAAFDERSRLLDDGLIDSFDMVTLVSELDTRFAISIDGADIVPDNFDSVGAIAALLEGYGVVT